MIENGVSNIAYFRTDGGRSKLYTQEYVDEKDKEIERLNKENKILRENAEHNDKVVDKVNWENKRLNNIINELEKWLEESIEKHTDDYIDWKYDRNVYLAGSEKLQNVFDKLQELKGDDKE